jgi:L-asparaginase
VTFQAEGVKGIILEAYGTGNATASRKSTLLQSVRAATERGVVVAITTQVLRGTVVIGGYAAGSAWTEAGAVSGHDMTTEALATKLGYLLEHVKDYAEVKRLLQTNLRGEMIVGGGEQSWGGPNDTSWGVGGGSELLSKY